MFIVLSYLFFKQIASINKRTKFIQLQSNYGEVIETPTIIDESDSVFSICILKRGKC